MRGSALRARRIFSVRLRDQEVAGSNPVAPTLVNSCRHELYVTCRWSAVRHPNNCEADSEPDSREKSRLPVAYPRHSTWEHRTWPSRTVFRNIAATRAATHSSNSRGKRHYLGSYGTPEKLVKVTANVYPSQACDAGALRSGNEATSWSQCTLPVALMRAGCVADSFAALPSIRSSAAPKARQ
jgi:hypothetical protein